MPISIQEVPGGYLAIVTPSKYKDTTWSSDAPTPSQRLVEQLIELGYHIQDIADAFDKADPGWKSESES